MFKYLKTFFYPEAITYSYKQPGELIIAKIHEILDRNNDKSIWSYNQDFKGNFLEENTFYIDSISPASTRGVKYSSTLIGKIYETQNGITQIITRTKPRGALYALFFISIIIGAASLWQFINTASNKFLLEAILFLFAGTCLSIGISNVLGASVQERYDLYIDKELTSL